MKKSKKKNRNSASPATDSTAAASAPTSKLSGTRLTILGLCFLLAAGASWAVTEFVIWNRIPGQMVGSWEVVHGPAEYKEAVFQFYRSGKMVGHVNQHGNLGIMNAEVRVEGDKMFVTTYRPRTNEKSVSVQTIRKLNDRELVVADERGNVMSMARMK